MKNYFIKMFNYNNYATHALLKAIDQAGSPDRAVQLMAHLLMAERRWLDRINGTDAQAATELWPKNFTVEICTQLADEYHNEWVSLLQQMPEADFEKIISYKISTGDNYNTSVSDILTHVINHGTHTRAQAGQQLKFNGAETLPPTDYVYFLRQING